MKSAHDGFTLLEVVIALAILAIAAAGLTAAAQQSLAQAGILEQKTFASWVAQNRMAEIRGAHKLPDIGTTHDKVKMAGREWAVSVTVEQTPNPDIRRMDIAVALSQSSTHHPSPMHLIGFMGRQ